MRRLRREGRLQREAVHGLQGQGGQDPDNPGEFVMFKMAILFLNRKISFLSYFALIADGSRDGATEPGSVWGV